MRERDSVTERDSAAVRELTEAETVLVSGGVTTWQEAVAAALRAIRAVRGGG